MKTAVSYYLKCLFCLLVETPFHPIFLFFLSFVWSWLTFCMPSVTGGLLFFFGCACCFETGLRGCGTASPSPHLCLTWLWPWSSVTLNAWMPQLLHWSLSIALGLLFLPHLVLYVLYGCYLFPEVAPDCQCGFFEHPLWLKHSPVISTTILPKCLRLCPVYKSLP